MKVLAFVIVIAGAVLMYTGYKGKTLKEMVQVAK